jgi:hypothetical protein
MSDAASMVLEQGSPVHTQRSEGGAAEAKQGAGAAKDAKQA